MNGWSVHDIHPSIGLGNDSPDDGQRKNILHDIYWELDVPMQWQEVGYAITGSIHDGKDNIILEPLSLLNYILQYLKLSNTRIYNLYSSQNISRNRYFGYGFIDNRFCFC